LIHSFDIFRIEDGGHVRWQGTQESFLRATKYVQRITMSPPGQYIILNQITGDKVVVGQASVPTQATSISVESGDAARNGMD
jgi:hypothetical protein